MRQDGIDYKVKSILRHMDLALRNVEGTPSNPNLQSFKFTALHLWNGTSRLFFTLNPHGIHSPLLIHFVGSRNEALQSISLDWNDDTMKTYYDNATKGNALFFHELAVRWPAAAALELQGAA